MDFLTTAFVFATIMATFCYITQRFNKHNYHRFDTITFIFISCFSGLVAVAYRIIYEIQTAYNYKQGIEHGFTLNIYELVTILPDVAFSDNWRLLTLWFFLTGAIVTSLQLLITTFVVRACSRANAGYCKVVFDFEKTYTQKVAYISKSVCIVAISITLAACTHLYSFLSHDEYATYDMSERIDVSDGLVSAISRFCYGKDVATVIRNRIYCEEQVGNFHYISADSITFDKEEMVQSIRLYEESGISVRPTSNLEHMFVLTWDRKTISDRSLFFLVHKDIAPPALNPTEISSWGTRYFKNLEKLIPRMPRPDGQIQSQYGTEWKELEVSLDK